jgi:surface polysaccharide O-acyltransferase-like enzyme
MNEAPPISREKISGLRFLLIAAGVMIHVDPDCVVRVADADSAGWPFLVSRVGVAFLRTGVSAVAVPMFFVLSGYLFFWRFGGTRREFVQKWNRRLSSSVVPYLAWSAAYLVLMYVWQSTPFFERGQSYELVREMTPYEILYRMTLRPMPFQFWFLRDLIVLGALSPAIWFLVRHYGICTLIVLGGVWTFRICPGLNRTIVSSTGVFFYTLGAWLAISEADVSGVIYGKRILLGVWLALAAAASYLCVLDDNRDWWIGITQVTVLIGIPAVWFNYDLVRPAIESRLGRWFSGSVFFIYAGHTLFLPGIQRRLFGTLWVWNEHSLVAALLTVSGFLIVVWACIAAVTRWLVPSLYAILSGGR